MLALLETTRVHCVHAAGGCRVDDELLILGDIRGKTESMGNEVEVGCVSRRQMVAAKRDSALLT